MFDGSHHQNSGCILIADDQDANRELLQLLLCGQGYTVITVPDGASAVAEFARNQVDLVLLDVMMPNLNGFQVCQIIKDNPDTYLIPMI